MEYVGLTCRCVLGVVFVAAALAKVRNRAAFTGFVVATGAMVPAARRFARPLAIAVIAGEVAVPASLAPARTAPLGFAVSAAMLGAFLTGTLLAIRRGTPARCACFGASGTRLGARQLVRDGALAAVALTGLCGAAGRSETIPAPAGALLCVVAGVLVATLLIRFDEIADVFSTS